MDWEQVASYFTGKSKDVLAVAGEGIKPGTSGYSLKYATGAGCSKLTAALVNVSLKFQMLISQIRQYFLLKKCEKLLQCKSFSYFFNKKFQCIWL